MLFNSDTSGDPPDHHRNVYNNINTPVAGGYRESETMPQPQSQGIVNDMIYYQGISRSLVSVLFAILVTCLI